MYILWFHFGIFFPQSGFSRRLDLINHTDLDFINPLFFGALSHPHATDQPEIRRHLCNPVCVCIFTVNKVDLSIKLCVREFDRNIECSGGSDKLEVVCGARLKAKSLMRTNL